MARLMFDIGGLPPGGAKAAGCPVLVRISGTGTAIRGISRLAPGPVDAAPVDFREWAAGLVPDVRAGLDPLCIEAAVAADLARAGISSPADAMAMSSSHRQMRWHGQGNAAPGRVPHGLCLPGCVIDPALSPEARREAFLRMVEVCLAETSGCRLPAGHSSERVTEFSLPKLLPLSPAELLPTWCGRHDPYRESAKREVWATTRGGLDYARISVKPDGCFVTAGVFNQGYQHDRNYVVPFAALARSYDVAVEITAWGQLTRLGRNGALRQRRSLRASAVAGIAEKYRVRSPDHLAGMFALGRYDTAVDCLLAIRSQLLHPSMLDQVVDFALSAAAVAAVTVDGLTGAVRSAGRKAGTALRRSMPVGGMWSPSRGRRVAVDASLHR